MSGYLYSYAILTTGAQEPKYERKLQALGSVSCTGVKQSLGRLVFAGLYKDVCECMPVSA